MNTFEYTYNNKFGKKIIRDAGTNENKSFIVFMKTLIEKGIVSKDEIKNAILESKDEIKNAIISSQDELSEEINDKLDKYAGDLAKRLK